MGAKLQILIATTGPRLAGMDILSLPQVDGVEYLVSCQRLGGIPDDADLALLFSRADIQVLVYDTVGLSVNRNHLLAVATAPYLLIADDDLRFYPEGLTKIIECFDTHTDLDIATFRSRLSEPKRYDENVHALEPIRDAPRVISFEIALRRDAVGRYGLRFSELMGVGAKRLCCGEENMFLFNALKRGARGMYFPIEINAHPGLTTSSTQASAAAFLRAKGATMAAMRGNTTALTRLPVEAWRAKTNFFRAFFHIASGMAYFNRHRKEIMP